MTTKISTNMLNQSGNLNIAAANVSLGPIANIHITGGTAGQVLKTDGSGNLSWVDQASSQLPAGLQLTVAGSNTEIQFNSDNTLGASPNLTFNTTTKTLSVENIVMSSSSGALTIPVGNTAQRPSSPTVGMVRYNTETESGEIYGVSGWASFGSLPPTITSVSPTAFNGASGTSFTLTGTHFTSDALVKFITASGSEYTASVVSVMDATTIVAVTSRNFTVADEPLSVKVVQNAGVYTLAGVIDCGSTPTWTTASGTLATALYPGNASVSATVVATDPDANTVITYSVDSGSLPSNLSLDGSSGQITGNITNLGASSVTTTFTLAATDQAGNKNTRSFNIIGKWQDGSTQELAATSASGIYALSSSFRTDSANGKYWIKLPGQATATQVYCLMDGRIDSGGWMLSYCKLTGGNSETYKQLWYSNAAWNNTTVTADATTYPVLPNNISFGTLGFTKQLLNNQHPSWITNKGNYQWYNLQTDVNWSLSGSITSTNYMISTTTQGTTPLYNRQQAWSGGTDTLASTWAWWADAGNGGLCGGANQCATQACPTAGGVESCHTNGTYPTLIFVK